jgi:hypothetical protein
MLKKLEDLKATIEDQDRIIKNERESYKRFTMLNFKGISQGKQNIEEH